MCRAVCIQNPTLTRLECAAGAHAQELFQEAERNLKSKTSGNRMLTSFFTSQPKSAPGPLPTPTSKTSTTCTTSTRPQPAGGKPAGGAGLDASARNGAGNGAGAADGGGGGGDEFVNLKTVSEDKKGQDTIGRGPLSASGLLNRIPASPDKSKRSPSKLTGKRSPTKGGAGNQGQQHGGGKARGGSQLMDNFLMKRDRPAGSMSGAEQLSLANGNKKHAADAAVARS
jgi:hypothetical protein